MRELRSPDPTAILEPARPTLAILIAVSVISPLSMTLILPSLPQMAADFGASPATMQWSITGYILASAVLMLVMGPLADRFGRRPVAIAAIAVYGAGAALCLAATELWQLFLGRTIQATATGGVVVARAMVRDAWPPDEGAGVLGYVLTGLALGPLVAPPLGGLVHELFGWRATFMVMLGLGLLVLLAILIGLPETSRTRVRSWRRMSAGYRLLLASAPFWWLSATLGLVFAGYFTFIGGGAFIVVNVLALGPAELGLWLASTSLGFILGSTATGRLAPRLGLAPLMLGGIVLGTGALLVALPLLLLAEPTVLGIFGPLFVMGIGNGMALPCIFAAVAGVIPRFAGSASGLSGSVQMFASAGATLAGGWVATRWGVPGPMFAAMAAATLCSLATALIWVHRYGR